MLAKMKSDLVQTPFMILHGILFSDHVYQTVTRWLSYNSSAVIDSECVLRPTLRISRFAITCTSPMKDKSYICKDSQDCQYVFDISLERG
jgi:hypothetical protein